jgi:hypothetical protein
MEKDFVLDRIFDAVETVTGVTKANIASRVPVQIREYYFARMIVTYQLRKHEYAVADICPLIGVTNPKAVYYQVKGYHAEKTPYFRECADRVNRILSTD